MRIKSILAILMTTLALTAGYAYADDTNDHDQARHALESGQILPLKSILEKIEPVYPGQVLGVELERSHGKWIYEIKLLQKDGMKIKLKINAADGTVLSDRKGK